MKSLKKFNRLPAKDKFLFAEALLFLYVAKTLLIFLPYKTCLRTINSKKTKVLKPELERLISIRKALHRANKLTWWKNICLVQSFAGSWMLSRRSITSKLLIGVAHDAQKKLQAHAWLTVEEYEIVPRGGDYMNLFHK